MKILFICDSLEDGKCGVGDHVRTLACELITLQHQVSIIALSDRFAVRNETVNQTFGRFKIPIFRIMKEDPWPSKAGLARLYLDEWGPDWISMHVSPYGFNNYGWLQLATKHVYEVVKGYPVQIMLHEIWIGLSKHAPFKEKLMGYIQKRALRFFVEEMEPRVVHTHINLYLHYLEKYKIEVRRLPIFSTIPIHTKTMRPGLLYYLQSKAIHIKDSNREEYLILGLFGSHYPGLNFENIAKSIAEVTQRTQRKLIILSIGEKPKSSDLLDALEDATAGLDDVETIITGFLDIVDVDLFMQECDLSICMSPREVIGKSSSAMGFLERAIPVITTRSNEFAPVPEEKLSAGWIVIEDGPKLTDRIEEQLKKERGIPSSQVTNSALQFLLEISNAE